MQASMQTSRTASLAPLRSRVRRSVAVRTRAAAAPVTWGNRSCHNGAHLSKERKAELEKVCEHIAQRGKGITACDEGPGARPRMSGPGACKCRDAQSARRHSQACVMRGGQAAVGAFVRAGAGTLKTCAPRLSSASLRRGARPPGRNARSPLLCCDSKPS